LGSNLGKGKIFFLPPNRADWLWAQSAAYSLCTAGSLPGSKAAGA